MLLIIYGIPIYIVLAITSFIISWRVSVHAIEVNNYIPLRIGGLIAGILLYYVARPILLDLDVWNKSLIFFFSAPLLVPFLFGILLLVVSQFILNIQIQSCFMQISVGAFWGVGLMPLGTVVM